MDSGVFKEEIAISIGGDSFHCSRLDKALQMSIFLQKISLPAVRICFNCSNLKQQFPLHEKICINCQCRFTHYSRSNRDSPKKQWQEKNNYKHKQDLSLSQVQ
jgi:hypothetical protein